ncbi:MAG: transposase [Chloroflexi bacterium]|nr:transposase [Chloroflexota bacterium]
MRRICRPRGKYVRYLYRLRHLVESGFCELKEWRGIAMRYAKKVSSYLANCHIRAIAIWAKVI